MAILRLLLGILCLSLPAAAESFGLQLYSLRKLLASDLPKGLETVRALGFTEVELAGTGTLSAAEYLKHLRERGLHPVSGHFSYEKLAVDLSAAIAEAKTLGLQFAVCPWIPHPDTGFDEVACYQAAADFDRWGAAFAQEGIRFAYHPHGFEFLRSAAGTMLDLLIQKTRPEWVSFEMDVFWIYQAGQDPVAWLEKYPDRWSLLHLKDLRKDAPRGRPPRLTPKDDQVALGTGQVDWRKVLEAAWKAGIHHAFLEDESSRVEAQLADSLRYLQTLRRKTD
jgi:sugar phosphate isomerase/epimerase